MTRNIPANRHHKINIASSDHNCEHQSRTSHKEFVHTPWKKLQIPNSNARTPITRATTGTEPRQSCEKAPHPPPTTKPTQQGSPITVPGQYQREQHGLSAAQAAKVTAPALYTMYKQIGLETDPWSETTILLTDRKVQRP